MWVSPTRRQALKRLLLTGGALALAAPVSSVVAQPHDRGQRRRPGEFPGPGDGQGRGKGKGTGRGKGKGRGKGRGKGTPPNQ